MNILFLIGNGFDLNLGMKTRYSDFYNYYQKTISKSITIDYLKKNITKDLENWSDLELALGEYTENIETVEEFDEVFEDIGDRLSEYLQHEESNFDFSEIDNKSLFDFLSFPERSLLKADADKIYSFKSKWKTSPWNVYLITFNYTKTIEKLLGEKQNNLEIGSHHNNKINLQGIEHIHGYTNDRMVMGVNDISQIKNTSFHKNQDVLDALVKNTCNQAYKHAIDGIFKQKISSANLICIFGSSIGDTDSMWWELIGQQLIRDCYLIIFDICEEIPARRAYKNARIERKIKESFLNKTQLSNEEKKKATKNIYIGLNTNMFKLN